MFTVNVPANTSPSPRTIVVTISPVGNAAGAVVRHIAQAAASNSDWQSLTVNRSVNYGNCWERDGSVTVPGASEIRLVLDLSGMEAGYDALYVGQIGGWDVDGSGDVVGVSGEFDVLDRAGSSTTTTRAVSGNTIQLLLDSDASVAGSFVIQRIEYKGAQAGQTQYSGTLFGSFTDDCTTICNTTSGCSPSESCYSFDDKIAESLTKVIDVTEVIVSSEGENSGLPTELVDADSKVWRIGPVATFAEPVSIQVPLPPDASLDSIELWYYSADEDQRGWYRAENVDGWLVPDSIGVVEDEGQLFVEFQVNHGGVFQIGNKSWFNVAPAGTLLVLIVAVMLGYFLAPKRRVTG